MLLEQLDERNLIIGKMSLKQMLEIDGVKNQDLNGLLELYPEVNASKLNADKVRDMKKSTQFKSEVK